MILEHTILKFLIQRKRSCRNSKLFFPFIITLNSGFYKELLLVMEFKKILPLGLEFWTLDTLYNVNIKCLNTTTTNSIIHCIIHCQIWKIFRNFWVWGNVFAAPLLCETGKFSNQYISFTKWSNYDFLYVLCNHIAW